MPAQRQKRDEDRPSTARAAVPDVAGDGFRTLMITPGFILLVFVVISDLFGSPSPSPTTPDSVKQVDLVLKNLSLSDVPKMQRWSK